MNIKTIDEENALFKSIMEMLREKPSGNITFAELHQIQGFAGDDILCCTDGETETILWAEISRAAKTAIIALSESHFIQIERTSIATYIRDGIILDSPLADNGGNTIWTPSVINKGKNWSN